MVKILFLFLHGCVLELVLSRLDLALTSSSCGDDYKIKDINEEAYVTYNGGWLGQDECRVEFVNYQEDTKQTCIKPINFKIGCTTKVEYSHFSKYSEKLYTCRNASFEEWCGPIGTTDFYLVIRTSGGNFYDDIKMHVYLKYYLGSDDGTLPAAAGRNLTGAVIVTALVPIVTLLVIVCIVSLIACIACRVLRRRRMQSFQRTPFVNQTGGQTGQGNVTQTQPLTGYNSAQPSQFQSTVQGGYQFHPMQPAYPVPQQQGYSPVTGNQPFAQTDIGRQSPLDVQRSFPNPSVPLNANVDSPPAYESVTK
ncbi:uncharacterized protein LOC123530173 isoform X1 [Mercenaria mercenaria]|uniref:uncharacterized protein LOC123530173 isoform X1 n=1 Tax=Mercenaria mercenaria TaxID=6596 RepID=UPI00234F5EFC|nr:uncharacterized protein LOC123530173 isoform X1 [Mercenaria mercenaria]XP_045166849.2 uncharacterized protein LOC123530173 isoform X1 [Mercenaria mercenaria]XP_053378119.1 uncharacterized protein LOC123530173 isoform X1 [Mercenaria mercenaria]